MIARRSGGQAKYARFLWGTCGVGVWVVTGKERGKERKRKLGAVADPADGLPHPTKLLVGLSVCALFPFPWETVGRQALSVEREPIYHFLLATWGLLVLFDPSTCCQALASISYGPLTCVDPVLRGHTRLDETPPCPWVGGGEKWKWSTRAGPGADKDYIQLAKEFLPSLPPLLPRTIWTMRYVWSNQPTHSVVALTPCCSCRLAVPYATTREAPAN